MQLRFTGTVGFIKRGRITRGTKGPPMAFDEADHQRLMRLTAELEREHEALRHNPDDRDGHAAHRDKLRQHLRDLQDYIARLQSGP
jgi:hypothetical protein